MAVSDFPTDGAKPELTVLTIYSSIVIVYSMVLPSDHQYVEVILLFSLLPGLVAYIAGSLLTKPIIKRFFEHHVAIARFELEANNGGEFDDWYSGRAEDKIDEFDRKVTNHVISIICYLMAGFSAPFVGYAFIGGIGVLIGIILLIMVLLLTISRVKEIVQTIQRTPNVIKNEN